MTKLNPNLNLNELAIKILLHLSAINNYQLAHIIEETKKSYTLEDYPVSSYVYWLMGARARGAEIDSIKEKIINDGNTKIIMDLFKNKSAGWKSTSFNPNLLKALVKLLPEYDDKIELSEEAILRLKDLLIAKEAVLNQPSKIKVEIDIPLNTFTSEQITNIIQHTKISALTMVEEEKQNNHRKETIKQDITGSVLQMKKRLLQPKEDTESEKALKEITTLRTEELGKITKLREKQKNPDFKTNLELLLKSRLQEDYFADKEVKPVEKDETVIKVKTITPGKVKQSAAFATMEKLFKPNTQINEAKEPPKNLSIKPNC